MKNVFLFYGAFLVAGIVFSCKWLIPGISHNNYFSLQNSSIYLIEHLEEDTTCYRSYDLQYNLPGEQCELIRKSDALSKEKKLGVSIRYSIRWIASSKGAPYGPYPNLGNIDSITSLKVELISATGNIDIVAYLEGDSTMMKYLWQKEDSSEEKIYGKNIIANKCCYEAHYVSNLETFRLKLIQQPNDLGVDEYDYIFWMDMNAINQLESTITGIQLTTILVDSLGRERELTDIALFK